MPAELATTHVATDDDRLLQAEAVVRGHCGWHIAPVRTETLTLAAGSVTHVLPTLRLVEVVSIVDPTGVALLADNYTVASGGVLTVPFALLPRYDAYWGQRTRVAPLVVTYRHGYDTPPPAVTAVVQALATRAINNPDSLVRRQVGPFSDTYSQTGANESVPLALLPSEKAALAPFTLPKRV